jgi:glycosyltransferase involved in cell wall biosynthesis
MPATEPRLRVLFAIPELDRGGPDAVYFNLLRTLDQERFEPSLLVTEPTGGYLSELPDRIPVLVAGHGRYPVAAVVHRVRQARPDVVMSTVRMTLTCAVARPFFPRHTHLICRVANNVTGELTDLAQLNARAKNALITATYRLGVELADRVIAQSQVMRDDIEHQFGRRVARKTVVLPNPVDADRLVRLSADRSSVPERVGVPQLVSAGRLSYQKGFDRLVRAFADIRARHPDARLWILGEGEDRDALTTLAAERGVADAVELLGMVPDPAALYRAADLYVCSSRYEGFPNSVAEALAVGTPAVVPSGAAAGEELVTPTNGRIVDDPDGPGLAAAALDVLDHLGDYDRAAIAAECRERFSLEAVTRRYEAVFRATAGRPLRPPAPH